MMRGGMVVAMVMVVVAVGAEVRTHCRENRLHIVHTPEPEYLSKRNALDHSIIPLCAPNPSHLACPSHLLQPVQRLRCNTFTTSAPPAPPPIPFPGPLPPKPDHPQA